MKVCRGLSNRDLEQDAEIEGIYTRLEAIAAEQTNLKARLVELQLLKRPLPSHREASSVTPIAQVTNASPAAEKVALFRRLFAGRADVFPVRWDNRNAGRSGYAPACANEWVRGTCGKPQVKCRECPHQAFIPVSDEVVERHLRGGVASPPGTGDYVIGVYPMLPDETCWFLAADFDGDSWSVDAIALLETCVAKGIPAALERSRSGNGGHLWIFFSQPVPVHTARQLGSLLVTETMERRPEIGFASYDRFFPSQDTMPIGGFGNLIALPLQRRARESGNSVFIDRDLRPYDDQWAFMSALSRLSSDAVSRLVHEAESQGRVLGVRMPVEDEAADEPWRMLPSRRTPPRVSEPLSSRINIVLADQIYIERTGLPPTVVAQLVRLAAFQNPEFYRAQSMRLPTFGKPRIISCVELHPKHVGLPRGCLDDAIQLIRDHGGDVEVVDRREVGATLPESTRFLGALRDRQIEAKVALAAHDFGVLAAATAFGKTIVAAALIAERARNTLVLVHRRELLFQWVERLKSFLAIDPRHIGIVGGGRRKPTGIVDVALVQSLVRQGGVSDIVADYGHLVVDECHHLSAASFELVARRAKAKYVLGLSATVARKDGHHPIIFMQCGAVRYRANARQQASESRMSQRVLERRTRFELPPYLAGAERPSIPAIYAALAADDVRNDLIFDDVLKALEAKRSPVVLTERRDHLELLRARFANFAKNLVVLRGGMSAAERKAAEIALRVPDDEERLILATGRYLGEGFDDPRLDTLFLTMPIAWKGTLAQYVGRLHREHQGKAHVLVYDYVDAAVPVLARMAGKRRAGYRTLGYQLE